jgi:PBSX family phage portal protein
MITMLNESDEKVEFQIDISAPKEAETRKFFDPLEQEAGFLKGFTGLSTYTKRKISKAAESRNSEVKYQEQSGYGILNIATPPFNLDELASFYDTSPTNHAAVVAKVSNIVGLGYNFEISDAAADKIQSIEDEEAVQKAERKIERTKQTMMKWLDTLNPDETFHHTMEKVATDFEVFGNGYIEIGRTVTGDIGYLGHVPAATMRVRLRKDGFVQIVGQHITFFSNFGESNPSPITNDPRPNEIIQLKKYSPRSSYYGVPDSVSCATAIVGDSLAANYNVKYFDNSATPRYIVTLTGGRLSKSAEDKLFKFLQTSLRGNPHRTIMIPLPLDINGNPVKFEMHRVDDQIMDGSWENYRERNKQDILLAHAVPLSRVGGASTTGQGTAASLTEDRMFKEQVVVPSQTIFEKAINRICSEKTDVVTFNLNELTLTDELAQSQINERYVRNQVMKINEARATIGLPAVPDGDKFFEPKPQQVAEQNAQANGTRTRDQERTANNSDSTTTVSGRNPKGAGSKE